MPRAKNPGSSQVNCVECGDSMTRYRKSQSGRYYCRKPECQAARAQAWHADRLDAKVSMLEARLESELANTAQFLFAALWHPRVKCPDCGLTDGLRGYAHLNAEGAGCGGLGNKVDGVTLAHAAAVWPESRRTYDPN